MRISKIILDNFRGYSHAEIDFNRFNCIVGKNDVGKSTIFEAIKWFLDTSQNDADDEFNISQLDHEPKDDVEFDDEWNIIKSEECYSPKIIGGYEMSVEIRFCDVNLSDNEIANFFSIDDIEANWDFIEQIFNINDFLSETNELCIVKSILHSYSWWVLDQKADFKPSYSIRAKLYQNKLPISLWDKKQLKQEFDSIFGTNAILEDKYKKKNHNMSMRITCDSIKKMSERIRNYYSENNQYKYDWISFDRTQTDYLSIIPKFRYFNINSFESEFNDLLQDHINSYLHQFVEFQKSINVAQKVINQKLEVINRILSKTINIGNLKLVPTISCKFNIQLDFTNGIDKISINKKGQGVQRILSNILFRYISNQDTGDESIFVFEEPENHLHPEAQKEFLKSLMKLSEKYNQVIITTHSPLMVSMCDVKDIIQIKMVNNEPTVFQNEKIKLQEVIGDLGLGPDDSMLSVFDNYNCILFVEGKNDIYTLNKVSELYKQEEKIPLSFEEMKCLIIPVGGCSSVEEWAKFGIVTKLSKPFVVLLDSDKKAPNGASENAKKLINVFKTIEKYLDETQKSKIKINHHNFMVTKKRELENYIKPSAIESFYNSENKNNLPEWKFNEIIDICNQIKCKECVEFSIAAFVYDMEYNNKVVPLIDALPNNREKKNAAEKIRLSNPIDKQSIIDRITKYINEYTASNLDSVDFREWVYCKEKGIDIESFVNYENIIGVRSYIYVKENDIDIEEFKSIYNQCNWINNDYYYLITYLLNRKNIKIDIISYQSKYEFDIALDDIGKKKMKKCETVKQEIDGKTIPDNITKIHFDEDIKNKWAFIDVPLAVYCSRNHIDYNENLGSDDNSKKKIKDRCKNIKAEINRYFFEEGHIKYEDLEFTYGNNRDEFLDLYKRIETLIEK